MREALSYSASCVQSHGAFVDFSKESEDCLYLNAWVPNEKAKAKAAAGKYSAMIFFYGGSFKLGSAMFPLYNGEPAASLRRNTVVVACNYRLNVFGFLGGDALRARDNSTGNFGIQG